ncbi:hypothetical protein C6I20_02920 [Aeromicrobium sp. A1-2]|uniref:DUF4383 domain-containing protein n=1 Tax=Aeromicrobium sp. A1-2 TaxID=2107713 RepID=UPI000EB625F6|nr:DUF4383 domain-containing protein [Aeromicrobium sp. A1-2]AXT84247.1 hypothetical protein C6I20_02920 [Aeromicrobium sp. A1-2]
MAEHKAQELTATPRTATQWTLLGFGLWFTVGNFVSGTVIWPGTVTDSHRVYQMDLFGFIPVVVNGWHLLFHLVTGIACLLLARRSTGAVLGSLGVAGSYLLVGGLGLAVSGSVLGVIATDTFGDWVHLFEGSGVALGAIAPLLARRRTAAS